jgi:hypothetical protein
VGLPPKRSCQAILALLSSQWDNPLEAADLVYVIPGCQNHPPSRSGLPSGICPPSCICIQPPAKSASASTSLGKIVALLAKTLICYANTNMGTRLFGVNSCAEKPTVLYRILRPPIELYCTRDACPLHRQGPDFCRPGPKLQTAEHQRESAISAVRLSKRHRDGKMLPMAEHSPLRHRFSAITNTKSSWFNSFRADLRSPCEYCLDGKSKSTSSRRLQPSFCSP